MSDTNDRVEDFKAEMAEVKLADPAVKGERRQTQLGIGLMVLGLVLIALGWYGASGVSEVWKEIPYVVSGGFGGLAVTFIGGILYLRASLAHQQRLMLVRLLHEMRSNDK